MVENTIKEHVNARLMTRVDQVTQVIGVAKPAIHPRVIACVIAVRKALKYRI